MTLSMVTPSTFDQAPDEAARVAQRPAAAFGRQERQLGLTIKFDGSWQHEGRPIPRPALVKLFASVLQRAADGSYWLVTPVERGRVLVEDVPFIAVELRHHGTGPGGRIELRTNLDEWVALGPDHPLTVRPLPPPGSGNAPYITVRSGLEARLSRAVYYELVELGESHDDDGESRFGVWSSGMFFALTDA